MDSLDKEELKKEISSSLILKIYNRLSKLSRYVIYYRWTFGALMLLSFIENLFGYSFFLFFLGFVGGIGVLYSFITGYFHYRTGKIIQRLGNKYDIFPILLNQMIHEILNSKKD